MVSLAEGASVTTSAHFDKEIELKKIDLVSEEIRNRFFTALGAYFSIMIAMIAASIDIGIRDGFGGNLPTINLRGVFFIAALVIVFLVVAWLTYRTIGRYKETFSRFQPLVKNVEDGKTNGKLDDILKFLRTG